MRIRLSFSVANSSAGDSSSRLWVEWSFKRYSSSESSSAGGNALRPAATMRSEVLILDLLLRRQVLAQGFERLDYAEIHPQPMEWKPCLGH